MYYSVCVAIEIISKIQGKEDYYLYLIPFLKYLFSPKNFLSKNFYYNPIDYIRVILKSNTLF